MSNGKVVGMITETDLFKVFFELMGARNKALRVTASIPEKKGVLAKITHAVSAAGGNFVSFGMFAGPDANSKLLTFKVEGLDQTSLRKTLGSSVIKFWDIRKS